MGTTSKKRNEMVVYEMHNFTIEQLILVREWQHDQMFLIGHLGEYERDVVNNTPTEASFVASPSKISPWPQYDMSRKIVLNNIRRLWIEYLESK